MFKLFQQAGRSAVDAAEAAVLVLENSEHFNAGCGSLLNIDGKVECDAMIMEGHTLNNGIASHLTFIPEPSAGRCINYFIFNYFMPFVQKI